MGYLNKPKSAVERFLHIGSVSNAVEHMVALRIIAVASVILFLVTLAGMYISHN